jgi:hypothetical protein
MHTVRVPSQDEVLQIFRKAGFTALTSLQEQLVPSLLRGRDIAAARPAGSGATVGFMAPLILSLRGEGPEPRALVIAGDAEDVGKATRAYTRFARLVRDAPVFVPLGETDDARKEQRRLEKGSTIVAGTTERVIDQIRRGSLPLGELRTVILEEPAADARADFIKDVQFIFAKISEKRQTILFTRGSLREEEALMKLLRHPVTIEGPESAPTNPVASMASAPASAPSSALPSSAAQPGGHQFFVAEGALRTELFARIVLGRKIRAVLAFHSPRADQRRISETLAAWGIRSGTLPAAGGSGPGASRWQAERKSAVAAFSRHEIDVLLVASGGQPAAIDLAPSHVFFLELAVGSARQAIGFAKGSTIMALVDRGQEKELAKLQEAGVTINRGQIPTDEEVLTGAIDRTLNRMKLEDPQELSLLRSRIRKQVPLLQRPLFMAMMLKSMLPPGLRLAPPKPAPQKAASAAPAARAEEPPKAPRTPSVAAPEATKAPRGRFGRIAEAPGRAPRAVEPSPGRAPRAAEPSPGRPSRESSRPPKTDTRGESAAGYTQLFVSIGRNRRVFARDLSALFTEKLQLTAGDIGGVRVFDKYSFVDVASAKAEDAIARLSGSELKGRIITVNYAKKKEEKEEK